MAGGEGVGGLAKVDNATIKLIEGVYSGPLMAMEMFQDLPKARQ